MSSYRLLVVEDEEPIRFSIGRFFAKKGFQIAEADSTASALERFREARPDVVLVDYCLPDGDGIQLLRSLRSLDPGVPVVMLTGYATIDLAVRAIKEGADQFLTKPVELGTLLVVVQRILENQRNQQINLAGRSSQKRQAVDPFLGTSPAIRRLEDEARKLLPSASPILIAGETGTGKGVLAAWLHRNSPRGSDAFVDLNCAGLSREFLETELFGHEKGAFTGAGSAKPGLFEIAHRGTVFLDEIGDVDLEVQPKLLKVLEERRFRRLGAVKDREVDVHLVAATHHDLAALVEGGRFRADLFYRVGALPLRVPPLRERGEDVIALARMLTERIGNDLGFAAVQLTPGAEEALLRRSWPGNIRELRNVLERAILRQEGREISALDVSEGSSEIATEAKATLTLKEAESRHIRFVLLQADGDVDAAAATLGLSRSALYQKIRKHGIPLRRPRSAPEERKPGS